MSERTRADELAEQIAVLFGWAAIRDGTQRERALNQLWHQWAEERRGCLSEHRELTDARIDELDRAYRDRRERGRLAVAELVATDDAHPA